MTDDSRFENIPDTLDARLQRAAASFAYPPTPNFAGRERLRVQQRAAHRLDGRGRLQPNRPSRPAGRSVARGLAWALAVLVLLAGLIWVSPARARVLEWLRLGAVRLFLNQDSFLIETPQPEALNGLAGEIPASQALEQAPFPLQIPAYPSDLSEPQRVYLQQVNGTDVAIMAWTEPDAPQQVRLVLYQIGEGEDVFLKRLLQDVQETFVNGEWALWTTGPYLLTTTGGQVEERRIVQGHTLIWSADLFTFRLETDLPLEEARKIAESLKEWQGK
jgi:hypothetical protein